MNQILERRCDSCLVCFEFRVLRVFHLSKCFFADTHFLELLLLLLLLLLSLLYCHSEKKRLLLLASTAAITIIINLIISLIINFADLSYIDLYFHMLRVMRIRAFEALKCCFGVSNLSACCYENLRFELQTWNFHSIGVPYI